MEKITYPIFKIGKSCSPSATPEVIKEFPALKVKMSCGGGMGGSRWHEYIPYNGDSLPTDTIIKRTNIFGEDIIINTRYVVCAEPIKVIVVSHDTSGYTNYRSTKPWCMTHDIHYIGIPPTQEYEVTDKYNDWETLRHGNHIIRSSSYSDGVCKTISDVSIE